MSKQNNIPQLRFQEFEGEIKEMKFGKVVQSNIYGPRFNANDYSDVGNVKTIRGTDLGSDGEIKYDQVPLALLDAKMVNTHKLLEGDIVMITTAECGATGVFRKQEIDFLSSAYGVRLRLNEKGYPYYFKYFFQTHQAKKEINSYIRKSTIANLPGSDILRIKVFLPSLPEQQKIASFLSTIDEKILQLSRKKELLEQYKKGVMQQLFSGKLRFKDENGNDYEDWDEKRLGSLTFKVGKKNKENIKYPIYSINNKEGFLPQSEQFDGLDSNDRGYDISLYKIVNSETFAYNPARINVGSIGYSYNLNEVIVSSLYVCFKTKEQLEDLYLLAYLDTYNFKKEILRFEEGGVRQYLFYENFSMIKIPLPSNIEQKKIAIFLSSIDAKIGSASQQLNQMQSFKKGLLQQMFV